MRSPKQSAEGERPERRIIARVTNNTPVREQLLAAAMAAIESGGEDGVRIDQISTTVGVTKSSIYHYFGSRDGMIVAAQTARYHRAAIDSASLRARIRACADRDEFAAMMRDFVGGLSDEAARDRRRTRISVLGSAASRPELAAVVVDYEQRTAAEFGEVLRIAEDRGWTTGRFSAEQVVLWWQSMFIGRNMIDMIDDPTTTDTWSEIAATAFLAVLFAEPD